MSEKSAQKPSNPLIVLGDRLARKPHLTSFLQSLRQENKELNEDSEVKFAVCADTNEVAVTLKRYHADVKMVLIGPGLVGRGAMVARMLARRSHIVMVIDPALNALGHYSSSQPARPEGSRRAGYRRRAGQGGQRRVLRSPDSELHSLGVGRGRGSGGSDPRRTHRHDRQATERGEVLPVASGDAAEGGETRRSGPAQEVGGSHRWRPAHQNRYPQDPQQRQLWLPLPRRDHRAGGRPGQRQDHSRDRHRLPDPPDLQQDVGEDNRKFWRHSLAVAFLAKLLALPADPASQSRQQKTEFDRYGLEDEEQVALKEVALWEKFDLPDGCDTFTAGLLHDMGKVTMLMCLEGSLELVMAVIESEVQDAQENGKMWTGTAIEVERFLMKDMDHQVIGGRLAQSWEIDSNLQQVIEHHHDVGENAPGLLKLIAFADMAANCLFPYPAADTQHPFPQLFARIDTAVKKSSKRGVAAVDQAISEEIFEDLVEVMSRIQPATHLWEMADFKSFFRLAYMIAPRIKSATIAFLQLTG